MVKCRLVEKEDGFGYHLYVNGVDVAPHVTGFTISCDGPKSPTLYLEFPIEEFESDVLMNLETERKESGG